MLSKDVRRHVKQGNKGGRGDCFTLEPSNLVSVKATESRDICCQSLSPDTFDAEISACRAAPCIVVRTLKPCSNAINSALHCTLNSSNLLLVTLKSSDVYPKRDCGPMEPEITTKKMITFHTSVR